MSSNFKKVQEFHKAFGLNYPTVPTLDIPEELTILRAKLIDEEVKELKEGVANNDLFNVAKELADILYVVYGYADCLGIDLDVAFAEVHRSNMSKLGPDGKPIYREDGKILKGPNYSPADMNVIWKPKENRNTVTIDVEDYADLLEKSLFLVTLKSVGVDNWEGYDIALDMMEQDDD
jgi:predicted HAD superfamily Cof-like phosphohydrolase